MIKDFHATARDISNISPKYLRKISILIERKDVFSSLREIQADSPTFYNVQPEANFASRPE